MKQTCLGVETSLRGRRWTLRSCDGDVSIYIEQTGANRAEAALLTSRCDDPAQHKSFLNPKLRDSLPDPSSLADMDLATTQLLDAMQAGRKITLFSDYDVDGGTSAAQLIRWGRGIGFEFGLYVPDRIREGYGPNIAALDQLKAEGVDLVVTLDCGAAAEEALVHADKIGLPVIVVDHHLMHGALPPALALVNPNRADDTSGQGHLAAAGVTFLLVVSLHREAKTRGLTPKTGPKSLLGLTALGTVCDVVPLKGVNRAFVRQGLKVLSANQNIGIQALADVGNTEPPYTTYHAGFVLGPRINAGGRIGQADMGAKLLSTEDAQAAYGHAAELDRVNTERRAIQDRILAEALELAEEQVGAGHPVIIVSMSDWHAGIVGIVAGRLKDRFRRPAIVIGVDENNRDGDDIVPIAKGSGRSVSGVDLGSAIAAAKREGLLISGGGHAMAGGLSCAPDKIDALRDYLHSALATDVEKASTNDTTNIDAVLSVTAINPQLMEMIERVGPYGAGNPQPVFAFNDVALSYATRTRGDHVRITFEDASGTKMSGIHFRANETGLDEVLLNGQGQRFHVIGQLKPNVWNGQTRIDFHLLDMAPTA